MSWRLQQKKRSSQPADQTRGQQRNHHSTRNIQPLSIGASAGRGCSPQRNRIGGIGRNRRNAREQQSRERDETAASGDGIQSSAQHSCAKKKENGFKRQEIRCIRNRVLPPKSILFFADCNVLFATIGLLNAEFAFGTEIPGMNCKLSRARSARATRSKRKPKKCKPKMTASQNTWVMCLSWT